MKFCAVNQLFSCCEFADGFVQFEDPKIVMRWPCSIDSLPWLMPWCTVFRIGMPAA
jgi:hypothetical protein